MTSALMEIGPLQQALALAVEAGDIQAMKDVHAMGVALQNGARARGLGISSENQAAEVVVRSERAIGLALLALRAAGKFGQSAQATRRHAIARGVQPEDGEFYSISDLGLTESESANFQAIAALDAGVFERMLAAASELNRRIAKHNFYAAPRSKATEAVRETPEDPGFASLRDGYRGLLGIGAGKDGADGATRNGFLTLPEDELRSAGSMLKALVEAYQEARRARA